MTLILTTQYWEIVSFTWTCKCNGSQTSVCFRITWTALGCEMRISPAILINNVTAISDFCPPNVNKSSPNCNPGGAATSPHGDC